MSCDIMLAQPLMASENLSSILFYSQDFGQSMIQALHNVADHLPARYYEESLP